MPATLVIPPRAAPVNDSEQQVIDALHSNLPATYTVITNFEFAQPGKPPQEYDAVVVAPHAVYVVEIKGYRGTVTGDNDTWWVANHDFGAPFKTTNHKARVLKGVLEKSALGVPIWVEPLIILSDNRVTLKLTGSVRDYTVLLKDAVEHLRNRERLKDKAGDLRPKHKRIVEAVQRVYGVRQRTPRRYGDYQVESELVQTDEYAEYLAKRLNSSSGKQFRLRVFAYNPYADPEVLARRKVQIQREVEALERLNNHPNLTSYRTHFTDSTDPNLYVTVIDYEPESQTLRQSLSAGASGLDLILHVGHAVAAGLEAIHAKQIFHRDIRPENIQIERGGNVRLINFDYARVTGVTEKTTILPRDMDAAPNPYLPPEWLDPSVPAAPSGDLFSLGVVLFEIATGRTLFDSPADAASSDTRMGEPNGYLTNDARLPDALNTLISLMIHADPAQRPQNAALVREQIEALAAPPAEPANKRVDSAAIAAPVLPAIFAIDDLINDKYSVQQVLKAGSAGRVYKVHDRFSAQVYALKVFNDSSLSEAYVRNEFKAFQAITQHKHIVTIKDVIVLRDGRYAIVSEYIEGDTLRQYIAPDTPLAIKAVLELMRDLLSALEHIHSQGWIHRDVKPENVILSKDGVRLIDFNIAVRTDQANRTQVGTPGYTTPLVARDGWTKTADVFAAGVIFYELVTGNHPYPNRTITRDEDRIDPLQFSAAANLSDKFKKLLLKAVSTRRGFSTASEFSTGVKYFLENTAEWFTTSGGETEVPALQLHEWEINRPNYNPFVTRFLRLYSQAARDNSGTRGLDTIASLTYADTLLDSKLREAVLAGQFRLVIITGNAGDGKTAFIQQVEKVAKERAAVYREPIPNGSQFRLNGIDFQTNYDGSQDEGATVNDSALESFFAPFGDDSAAQTSQPKPIVRLIAINQGRLLDFFLDPDRRGFSQLRGWVDRFFTQADLDGSGFSAPDWLQIVDLNQRSMTALDNNHDSIFNRQIAAFVEPRFWQACQACHYRDNCFIKYNVDSLADSALGSIVRERMRTLFEIVHLRRKLHITMRDLRSALIWMLMRDHDCDSVAQVIEKDDPITRLSLLYYSAFATDGKLAKDGTDDRLVSLLRDIDPALVANPVLDRALHEGGIRAVPLNKPDQRPDMTTHQISNDRLRKLYLQTNKEGGYVKVSRLFNHLLRRIVFFEGRGEEWRSMTPYSMLQKFQDAARDPEKQDEIRRAIARGVSRLEGLLPQEDDDSVYIRAGSETRTSLNSFRTFPLDEFTLRVPAARSQDYAEYMSERIIFAHNSGAADLVLSLDLLELLHQTADGYVLLPDVRQGIYMNYLVFRRALMHLPYSQVLLQRPNGERFRLTHQDNMIALEPVSIRDSRNGDTP